MSDEAVPVFKPKGKKKTILKARITEEEENKAEEEQEDVAKKIREAQSFQKLRSRPKGVTAVAAVEHSDDEEEEEEEEEAPKYGLLNAHFKQQTDRPQEDKDKHLEQWLEEKMNKKKGIAEAEPEKKELTAEDELYQVPENLQGIAPVDDEASDTTNWLTGLVEVSLPVEYKLKNIEDTELAKRQLIHNQESSNMSARHRKYFNMAGTEGGLPSRRPRDKKESQASDDLVLSKFKKRQRFR